MHIVRHLTLIMCNQFLKRQLTLKKTGTKSTHTNINSGRKEHELKMELGQKWGKKVKKLLAHRRIFCSFFFSSSNIQALGKKSTLIVENHYSPYILNRHLGCFVCTQRNVDQLSFSFGHFAFIFFPFFINFPYFSMIVYTQSPNLE